MSEAVRIADHSAMLMMVSLSNHRGLRLEGQYRRMLRKCRPILIASLLTLLLLPHRSSAEVKVFTVQQVPAPAGNVSAADARRISVLEAKRTAVEKAGAYIAGLPLAKEYRLTKNEAWACAAALARPLREAGREDAPVAEPGGTVQVTASIDTAVLAREIERYRESEELRRLLDAALENREELRAERSGIVALTAGWQDAQQTLGAVLDREEAAYTAARVWSSAAPFLDLFAGSEINGDVRLEGLDRMVAELEKAVAADPENLQARILLSVLAGQKKDLPAAERQLRAALAQDPGNLLLHLRVGIVLRERDRPQEALKELRVVEKKRPNHPPLLFQVSLAHKAAGNCRLASGYAKRFLMYTRRNDRPDIARMKAAAEEIVKECGDFPPPRRTKRR